MKWWILPPVLVALLAIGLKIYLGRDVTPYTVSTVTATSHVIAVPTEIGCKWQTKRWLDGQQLWCVRPADGSIQYSILHEKSDAVWDLFYGQKRLGEYVTEAFAKDAAFRHFKEAYKP